LQLRISTPMLEFTMTYDSAVSADQHMQSKNSCQIKRLADAKIEWAKRKLAKYCTVLEMQKYKEHAQCRSTTFVGLRCRGLEDTELYLFRLLCTLESGKCLTTSQLCPAFRLAFCAIERQTFTTSRPTLQA